MRELLSRADARVSRLPAALWWTLLAGFSGLIFFVSSRRLPDDLRVEVPGFDKLQHFAAFGVWTSLCLAGLRRSLPERSSRWRGAAAVAVAGIYGLSDEVHQAFIPGRIASVGDLLADLLGAAAAVLFWGALARAVREPEAAE